MDLNQLNNGIPSQKLFLNPVVNVLTAAKVVAGPSLAPVVTSQYKRVLIL